MKALLTLISIFAVFSTFSQGNTPSIHEVQLNEFNNTGNTDASYYEALPNEKLSVEKTLCNLDKVVYGWHPYWGGSAYQNYQWDLLSHMSFFSYDVNAADGEAISTHGWSTSLAVDAALASGNTKVTLCVTLFSGHNTFFGSPIAQQTLISNLISLVQSRGAHGVNIDFEGLPSSQTTNFANFMVDLCDQMHTAIPGSEVSTVLYAVDWNNVFDFSIMEPVVDHYIIMGYGYYYTGSSTAGPTDPLYHYGSNYNYTLSKSITYYLDKGCPKEKLILGLPNYGYEWPTTDLSMQSTTTGGGSARTYAYVKNNTSGNYSAGNHTWEGDSYTDVYAFNNGENRQCLISLDSSWSKRLDHVRKTGIGGIGIWALSYDNGYTNLWEVMEEYLTDCYETPCSGTIHDFGGPTRNYYNDEDYTWTLEPPNATSIDIDFPVFDVELDWDYLYIYDGNSTASPQITGSPFTGTTGPGTFTTSTGAVTFRFTSDGATVTPGFLATYSCNSMLPPTSDFNVSATNICVGDSILLNNTSTGAESYLWSTSSGGISDVFAESPYLFPSSSGTYNITLESTNTAGTDNSSQTIEIVVNQQPIAGVDVNSTELVLPNAVAFFTNSSTNATSYYWDFGDMNNSTDENPWHEYAAAGVYNGYLIASNDGCPNDTTFFTINVGNVGTEEITSSWLNVYPNPFNEQITLKTDSHIEDLTLLDAQGKQLNFSSEGNEYERHLSLENLSSGVYILKVSYANDVKFVRIVKD